MSMSATRGWLVPTSGAGTSMCGPSARWPSALPWSVRAHRAGELPVGEGLGVGLEAALRAADGRVHDGGLRRHLGGERVDGVLVEVGDHAQPALARAAHRREHRAEARGLGGGAVVLL